MSRQLAFHVSDNGWGDGGKIKAVCALISRYRVTMDARVQGGNNSGGTFHHDGREGVRKIVPVGVTLPDCTGVIGPYVLVMPWSVQPLTTSHSKPRVGLLDEIQSLRDMGFEVGPHNLLVDGRCNLQLPWHLAIEAWSEGDTTVAIGTTASGMGPTYAFLHARKGVRVIDCLNRTHLRIALERVAAFLKQFRSCDEIDPFHYEEALLEFGMKLEQNVRIVNAATVLRDAWRSGQSMVYESSQGAGLDVVTGTVPYATASFCSIPNLGLWVPREIQRVLVTKAYDTRVGTGWFPSKITDPGLQSRLREAGKEYGATTGRPRDCGWKDMLMLRQGALMSGADWLFVTKLDVLAGMEPQFCVGYDLDSGGEHDHTSVLTEWPLQVRVLEHAKPVLAPAPRFDQQFFNVRQGAGVPDGAWQYLRELVRRGGVPVGWLSTGPDTNAMIPLGEWAL